ncbi:hypothetical protein O181_025235 [Austropuccinia psidii MF-1]|uniref:Uncharacterized protein n=1 Tax=Austropuccinia psidii MF-1 TaxID=1389203 RepID=A0A9Q3CM88_9BASI|nr:hypothetical protein [Austropuccinia psidii MF-1]
MAEITPILQHFQDVLTGKVPFDQFPKSQEDDDKYYEDPLECKNIHGGPQEAKNKNKNKNKREPSIFKIIESQYKRRGRPPSKVISTTTSRSSQMSPLKLWKWTHLKTLKILRPHYLNPSVHQIHYPQQLN